MGLRGLILWIINLIAIFVVGFAEILCHPTRFIREEGTTNDVPYEGSAFYDDLGILWMNLRLEVFCSSGDGVANHDTAFFGGYSIQSCN